MPHPSPRPAGQANGIQRFQRNLSQSEMRPPRKLHLEIPRILPKSHVDESRRIPFFPVASGSSLLL